MPKIQKIALEFGGSEPGFTWTATLISFGIATGNVWASQVTVN
jgi:hypothetical protein